MQITFVLPIAPLQPIGGVRVVYRYAHHLRERGHEVTVVFPVVWSLRASNLWRRSYWKARRGARALTAPPAWLGLTASVPTMKLQRLTPDLLPSGDAIFATGWQTAGPVFEAPARCGRKFQLVQHYETWIGSQAEVDESLRLPMVKVAISRWLVDVIAGLDDTSTTVYIPNGLDFSEFHIEPNSNSHREPARVAMMVSNSKWKGTSTGMEALALAHEQRPQIQASLFSSSDRPQGLPNWMTYRQGVFGADLRRLYNECGIFLHTSLSEGWGLPPAEAMACGCAVVATDNPGVLDYAVPNQTALVAPRGDAPALAASIVRLVDDEPLRTRIAQAGHEAISGYTWERAVTSLEAVLLS